MAKGWQPIIDVDSGSPISYYAALREGRQKCCGNTCEGLQQILRDAAFAPGVQKEVNIQKKPWQSADLQDLLRRRRDCGTAVDRKEISKSIQNLSRFSS